MIVSSIDLRNGRIIQLRQGREHVLTSQEDPLILARQLNRYGPVAVIDLDAALGTGDNLPLVCEICRVAEVRAGGGIRNKERGLALLKAGAQSLIIGTAATAELLREFPRERVIVALDHLNGSVLDQGWTNSTGESVTARAQRLAPYCGGFLCTFVKDEGGMLGLPMNYALTLRDQLPRPTTFAGGVATTQEAIALSMAGLDVQVGMALYTGNLDLAQAVVGVLDFQKMGGLIPTIVQDDETDQVLMLAYSSPESLAHALKQGIGAYWSRSRQELWVKGLTSGHTQQLISCRPDCDRDSLLFRVRQTGPACHTGSTSCFGPGRFTTGGLFSRLTEIAQKRPNGSYTARLLKDPEYLLRKIMEEAFEVTRARTYEERRWEVADLLYHLMVWLVSHKLTWKDVGCELSAREKEQSHEDRPA